MKIIILTHLIFCLIGCSFAGQGYFSCVNPNELSGTSYKIDIALNDHVDSMVIDVKQATSSRDLILDVQTTQGVLSAGITPSCQKSFLWKFDGCFSDVTLTSLDAARNEADNIALILRSVLPVLVPTGISPGGSTFISSNQVTFPFVGGKMGPNSPQAEILNGRLVYKLTQSLVFFDAFAATHKIIMEKEAVQTDATDDLRYCAVRYYTGDSKSLLGTITMERLN